MSVSSSDMWSSVRSLGLHRGFYRTTLTLVLTVVLSSAMAMAQGSIHGTVTAASGDSPADGEVSFVGYLGDSDEEIRIEFCLGAGYEAGHWYDDFQNFLGEAPGVAYDYHFYAASQAEGYVLSGLVPDNSYQEENITLEAVVWPDRPPDLIGTLYDDSAVLAWTADEGLTYHVYRREEPSEGSFFRIDVGPGQTDDPGIDGGAFSDYDIESGVTYDYVLVGENDFGQLSPHSDVLTLGPESGCCRIRGDIDHSESATLDISDLVYLVNFMFQAGDAPACLEEADINADGSTTIDITDLIYLVSFMFQDGPAPDPCR